MRGTAIDEATVETLEAAGRLARLPFAQALSVKKVVAAKARGLRSVHADAA